MIINAWLGKADDDLKAWWQSLPAGRRSQALKQALRTYLERAPLEETLEQMMREIQEMREEMRATSLSDEE